MLWIILFIIVFIAVNVIDPFFVKEQMNGASVKSLALKMAGATGYLITGLLAMKIGENFSKFSWLLFTALVLCWIGDLFLHLWQSKIFPVIGFLGFLSGHFVFIAAFLTKIKEISPERSFFSVPEVIAVLLFCVFFLVFSAKIGTNIKGIIAVPLLIYAAVITTMLCKASVMGIHALLGASSGIFAAIIAILGALLFVASDFSIAILMFNEKYKKNYPLKMFNMTTYFLAVLLLSALPAVI
ncbi:MAG: hypothetical protein J1E34_02270 [Oscillospiraceae bacterium]|nr:hypothetical protein [Oscillospiraceae bacterium]